MRQRQGVVRERGRSRPVVWLDPVAASPTEVAIGALFLVVLGLVAMVWGAAVLSSWVAHGQLAPVGVNDAAVAMARLGAGRLRWDGVWDPTLEPALGSPTEFWLLFAAEGLVIGLLFWPVWRLIGPRPGDPLSVMVAKTPALHPRAERRRTEREAAEAARGRTRDLAAAVAPADRVDRAWVAPAATKILVSRPRGDRMVLGRVGRSLVATESQHSVIVFGPTRSGKTSALTVPAVLDWAGPVVVCTTKADIVSLTWDHRASQDAGTWLVDPMATMRRPPTGPGSRHMMKRYSWTPLQVIEEAPRLRTELDSEHRARQWALARRTAQWMVRAAGGPSLQDRVDPVLVVAEQLLAPLLLAATSQEVPMSQVVQWLDSHDDATVALVLERTGVPEATATWAGTHHADQTLAAAARRHLAVVLYPYSEPALSRTRDPEISIRRLLDGRANTLYLLAPPQHGERLRPLLATLMAHIADAAMGQAAGSGTGRLAQPLLVVIDDALGCAPAAVIDQLAASGAGVGIQLLSVFSDLAQLERAFGQAPALQLANNHRARVVLPGVNDGATLHYLNDLVRGNRLLGYGNDDSKGDGLSDGPVIGESVNAVRTLADGEAICVYGNLPPIRMRLRPWFTDPNLAERVDPSPSRSRGSGLERWRRRLRRGGGGEGRRQDRGQGRGQGRGPDPLDSEANNREAERYWDAVVEGGTLPEARPPGDGSSGNPASSLIT